MRPFGNRLERDTRGTIAVEFALIAPVLVLMAMGVADYGRAMTMRSELDAAARAGLQVLIRNFNDLNGARTAAEGMAAGATVNATVVCKCPDGTTISCTVGTCPSGVRSRTATIAVTRPFTMLVPWPQFDDPMSLQATAVGRLR